MTKINIRFPEGFTHEQKDWIESTVRATIRSVSSSIGIYFKVVIKNCEVLLDYEKEDNL